MSSKPDQFPQLSEAEQRRIMDFAASTLENVLLLGERLQPIYRYRLQAAIKLLRHPPKKKSRRFRG